MAAGAGAAKHASVFPNLRALDVLAGVFGPAEIVKDVGAMGAIIRAVRLGAYVELDSFL
jgi:hypothetical protein